MALATFNSGVRKGNPKAEFRRPKEGRSSKFEELETDVRLRASHFSGFGFRFVLPKLHAEWLQVQLHCLIGFWPSVKSASSAVNPLRLWLCQIRISALLFLAGSCLLLAPTARADDTDAPRKAFEEAKRQYQRNSRDVKGAWEFARSTFDLADVVTSKSERAEVAQQGINACTQALQKDPDSAPVHYYLALNQGELARTKTFGALRLVDQMEREFLKAIELDPKFDYAGPDRSLGLLYRDAPAFGSIGSRTKAKAHLERAVELVSGYPENRLTLIESELKWNDRKSARRELKLLEDSWPAARKQFIGSMWTSSWTDWDNRLDKIKRALGEPARLESPRH